MVEGTSPTGRKTKHSSGGTVGTVMPGTVCDGGWKHSSNSDTKNEVQSKAAQSWAKGRNKHEETTPKPHTPARGKNPAPEEGKGGINVSDLLVLQEWMWADSRT